jgi:uncharacterized protein
VTETTIDLSRCTSCQAWFLPTDGPCPHCGSVAMEIVATPGIGTVLSATELLHPAEGWGAPHRLALVEMPQSVRLLAVVDGPLPVEGTLVSLRRDGEVYRAHPGHALPGRSGRGEGEFPRAGASDASFEPPR